MSEMPALSPPHLVRWTGPMRRAKKFLHARGYQVVRAGRVFLPWHLLAIHPTEGVRLLYVHPPHGPGPEPPALAAFTCDPAWAKELWHYPASVFSPKIRRIPRETIQRADQDGTAEAPRP